MREGTTKRLSAVWILIILLLSFVLWALRTPLYEASENLLFRLSPSAARAYELGVAHFSSAPYQKYNIHLAQYYLEQGALLDPRYPYLQHQLARVYFLEGNYVQALTHINDQIAVYGDAAPRSYYVRALIEGYMGNYKSAAKDYEHFIALAPDQWAGYMDYSWVLLKAGRTSDALGIIELGLNRFPGNPWLLNSESIALFELGKLGSAERAAKAANTAVKKLTPADWSRAYPGNDPNIAAEGLFAFEDSVQKNLRSIEAAYASSMPKR